MGTYNTAWVTGPINDFLRTKAVCRFSARDGVEGGKANNDLGPKEIIYRPECGIYFTVLQNTSRIYNVMTAIHAHVDMNVNFLLSNQW